MYQLRQSHSARASGNGEDGHRWRPPSQHLLVVTSVLAACTAVCVRKRIVGKGGGGVSGTFSPWTGTPRAYRITQWELGASCGHLTSGRTVLPYLPGIKVIVFYFLHLHILRVLMYTYTYCFIANVKVAIVLVSIPSTRLCILMCGRTLLQYLYWFQYLALECMCILMCGRT